VIVDRRRPPAADHDAGFVAVGRARMPAVQAFEGEVLMPQLPAVRWPGLSLDPSRTADTSSRDRDPIFGPTSSLDRWRRRFGAARIVVILGIRPHAAPALLQRHERDARHSPRRRCLLVLPALVSPAPALRQARLPLSGRPASGARGGAAFAGAAALSWSSQLRCVGSKRPASLYGAASAAPRAEGARQSRASSLDVRLDLTRYARTDETRRATDP
jgi:hypothetical protein